VREAEWDFGRLACRASKDNCGEALGILLPHCIDFYLLENDKLKWDKVLSIKSPGKLPLTEGIVMLARFLLLVFFPLLATGCAIKTIPATGQLCEFLSYDLAVARPPGVGDEANTRATFGDLIGKALFGQPHADAAAPGGSMLFLSGGSLHGAFGAGFLAGWKQSSPSGHLPDFTVVTGISTGAILSTFAFVDDPERAVQGYTIENESELLKPFGGVKDGNPTASSYLALVQRGALADLAPLRERLRSFFDDTTLRKVAAGGANGRKLLIGVVDVDTGQAVVLDLTDMARQYVDATDEAARTVKRNCYVEGVVASSSAPLAALPVFIDNRMYIDGGARFGMFSDEVGAVIQKPNDSPKPVIYLLINGDQEIAAQCGKADPTNCPGGSDPAGNIRGPHEKWSFPKLALRSEGILTNQVYRFSAKQIYEEAVSKQIRFRPPIQIEGDMPDHRFPRTGAPDSKTCTEWRALDRAQGDPLQFYPHYMRCVIDYGQSRVPGEIRKWDQQDRTLIRL
jgi:hypothetical protein